MAKAPRLYPNLTQTVLGLSKDKQQGYHIPFIDYFDDHHMTHTTLPPLLTSAQNSRIKTAQKIANDARYRQHNQTSLIEGIHLITDAIRHAVTLETVFLHQDHLHKAEIQALLPKLPSKNVFLLPHNLMNKISTLQQSSEIAAIIATPTPVPWQTNIDTLALEAIQDPGNLGTIMRSAAAFGIQQILLSRQCVDVFAPKVWRAAMGAHFLLNLYPDIELIDRLRQFNGKIAITTLNHPHPISLYASDLRSPIAWVFGNEGAGVSNHLAQIATQAIHIPMNKGVESLNVAMAATVCLAEQYRQRTTGNI